MEIEGLEGLNGTDLIQETFLFRYLNFDETMGLARIIGKEKRKKGDTVIEEGALGQALYVVEKGEVEVYKTKEKRQERLAVLGRGEMFGEMSLIEDELTSASVVVGKDAELLVIKRLDLERMMDDNRELAFKIYKTFCHVLSERLRRTSNELGEIKAELDSCEGGKKDKPARSSAPAKKSPAKKPSGKGKKK